MVEACLARNTNHKTLTPTTWEISRNTIEVYLTVTTDHKSHLKKKLGNGDVARIWCGLSTIYRALFFVEAEQRHNHFVYGKTETLADTRAHQNYIP